MQEHSAAQEGQAVLEAPILRSASEELLSKPSPQRRPSSPQRLPSRAPENRVVVLLSNPLAYVRGTAVPGVEGALRELPVLNLEDEASKLRQALRDGADDAGVDVELQVRIATVDALRSAVTLGARVVHFAGHGNENLMMFEDGRGGAKAVEPEALRRLVSAGGAGACRLVVVNSCSSEAAGRAFVAAGVPHVVAVAQSQNDGRISDRAAGAFCQAFYLSLMSGDSVRTAFDVGCAAAQQTVRGALASQRLFVLLPEDKPHDEPVFSPIPGSFRETTPPPPPSNAPPAPSWYVGRASDLCVCVEAILRHRLTTIGGPYGSGKSALAASAAAYASRRRHFDAVVWVKSTTRDRFVDDVADAAARVLERAEDDALSAQGQRPALSAASSFSLSRRSTPLGGGRPALSTMSSSFSPRQMSRGGSLDDDAALDASALADLARAGKVLVVLDDFERLMVAVPRHELAARARCWRLLGSLLESCPNIHLLLTCSSGSGIGRVPGVTERVVTLGPLALDQTATLLLQRAPELMRRASNSDASRAPKVAPDTLVAACAAHPVTKRLNGLPFAVSLAVSVLNNLFASEEAAKSAAESAGGTQAPPMPPLEALDRVLRVLDATHVDPELQRLRDELAFVVQYGQGYSPEGEKATDCPSDCEFPDCDEPSSPTGRGLGARVEPRQLALGLAAVWAVRLAADAVARGTLALRLDAVVHLLLDAVAVALVYEARGQPLFLLARGCEAS